MVPEVKVIMQQKVRRPVLHFQYSQSKITGLKRHKHLNTACQHEVVFQLELFKLFNALLKPYITIALFQTLCSHVLWDSKPGFVLSLFLIFLPKSRLLFL